MECSVALVCALGFAIFWVPAVIWQTRRERLSWGLAIYLALSSLLIWLLALSLSRYAVAMVGVVFFEINEGRAREINSYLSITWASLPWFWLGKRALSFRSIQPLE